MYDWKVTAQQYPYTTTVQLFVWREQSDNKQEFMIKGGTEIRTLDRKEFKNGNDLVFAEFPTYETSALALAALDKMGLPLPTRDFTAGKLEATEKHLLDMRQLVFDNGPQVTQTVSLREQK